MTVVEKSAFLRGMLRAAEILNAEPEYPGEMPDLMWSAMCQSKDIAAESLRLSVRLTKENVCNAIAAELEGIKAR